MLKEPDFYQEFLIALQKHNVEYLIFGGYAVNFYGFTRMTEDLDVWINPDPDNLKRFKNTVADLSFPETELLHKFISGELPILRLSDDRLRVDILTKLSIKKNFYEAFACSQNLETDFGKIFFIGYDDLIDEKIRAKRPKDLLDVDQLRTIRKEWNSE
jgi:hypothetical protein